MPAARAWEPAYARRAECMKASEIRELLKLLEQPGIISFAGGIPDPALFPTQAAATAYAEALASAGDAAMALQYSVSEGHGPLREWIAHYMASRGVPASPENIIITAAAHCGRHSSCRRADIPWSAAGIFRLRTTLRHDTPRANQPDARFLQSGGAEGGNRRSREVCLHGA